MTGVLLDTNALLWLVADLKLGEKSRALIASSWLGGQVQVSAFSFWEVAMLVRKRRLTLAMPVLDWRRQLLAKGLVELPVTGEIAINAEALAGFHGDPADRLIASTATHHQLTLITSDQAILAWPGKLDRLNALA